MARMILVCSVVLLILGCSEVSGANLSLAWNRSPSANVARYAVQYGVASGQYTSSLGAGTSTTVTVTGLTPGQTYYFVVTAFNTSGVESPYSNEITNTLPSLPLVLTQPMSQTVVVGTIVVLSFDVVSQTPVKFQWYMGGKAINGETNSMLILPQILKANAGAYAVVASNAAGSVTSQTAVITILDLAASPPVPAPAGVYNGLFYQTNAAGAPAVTEATTGLLSNCTIGTNGAYSSCLIVEGKPFICSGLLNAAGEINAIAYAGLPGVPNLSLTLFADAAFGTERLTGVVSNMNSANPWVAFLSTSLATSAFSPAADYVFLSPPPPGQLAGYWTCQFTITANGVCVLAGQLGDSTPILQAAPIGVDGSFPVYQSLYNHKGLLAGWITFAHGAPIGNLTWIHPASLMPAFTNVVSFGAEPGSSTNRFLLIP
jgi:hypothetical protein